MEVSSHALVLDRVYGVKYAVGIFTCQKLAGNLRRLGSMCGKFFLLQKAFQSLKIKFYAHFLPHNAMGRGKPLPGFCFV